MEEYNLEELNLNDVGETFTLKIQGYGSNQDPFGRIKRKVVFLKNCSEHIEVGEEIQVRITNVASNTGFCEPIENREEE